MKKHLFGIKYNSVIEQAKLEAKSDNRLGGGHSL